MMLRILKPFMMESAHRSVVAFGLGFAVLLGLKVLGLDEGSGFAYLIAFGPTLLGMNSVSSNLSWLLSLPITKNRIMVLSAVFTLFNSMVLVLNLVAVSAAHSLLYAKPRGFVRLAEKIAASRAASGGGEANPLGLSELAFLLGAACMVFVALFPHRVNGPGPAQALSSSPTSQSRAYLKIGCVLILLFIAAPFAIAARLVSPFSIFLFFVTVVPLGILLNSLRTVGFSAIYRRAWMRSTGAVCLAFALLVYGVSLRRLADDKPVKQRFESFEFLGFFAGKLSQKSALEEFLREPLASGDARSASRYYSAIANRGFFDDNKREWIDQRKSALKFADVIANKDSGDALHAVGSLFDPGSLGAEDLDLYLARERHLAGLKREATGSNGTMDYQFWLRASIPESKVLELLSSDHLVAVQLGLAFARFDPKQSYIDKIVEGIRGSMPNRALANAAFTLSTITAAPYSLRELASISNKGLKRHELLLYDCKGFEAKRNDTSRDGIKRYGQCSRRKAFQSKAALFLASIDRIGRDLDN